jgi:sugar (pentulose or hexulose) kinase
MSVKSLNCIAFDLGASGGKVLLGEYQQGKINITEVYRFSNAPIMLADHIYWDFLHLFEEVKKGLQLACKSADGQVASIGLDTWGVDCSFLDKKGHLLGNPFSYRDPRTNGIMERAFRKMTRQEIFAHTGVQFMQLNTLFQLFATLEEDEHAFEPVGTFLMIPDLFNYYLTGKKGVEFTNATTTQFFDPLTCTWDNEILQSMGIPRSIFPEVIQPGTILGELAPWLCEELDIKGMPVVTVATHDTASALSAVPSNEKDVAFLSSGTWSLMGTEGTVPVINEMSFNNNFSNYGGVCNTWAIWKNIQALWLLQECMRHWVGMGKKFTHEDIILLANQAKPFGPILDSDDLAFFTPGDFPERISEYCRRTGQTPPEGEGAIVRCILESLALKYRYTFERLQEVVGKKLNQIFVIGGGSRNWLLNKFTSEALGIPLKAGPVEATAIGNIMQQLIALKEMDCLNSCRNVIQASFETASFEPAKPDEWDQAYGRYLEIIHKSNTFNQ